MPSDLVTAISHAVMVIGWQENLLEAEIPPRWTWTLDDELGRHFDWIRSQRESGSDIEPMDGPTMQNEYARNRGRNAR